MTLIALKLINKIPVLFTDVLLSSEVVDKNYTLPGLGTDGVENTNLYIAGLKQKTFIIDNCMAFAWAGSYTLAHDFKRWIENTIFYNATYTWEEILEAITKFEKTLDDSGKGSDLACIIVYNKEKSLYTHFNCILSDTKDELDYIVAGSGKEDFIELNKNFKADEHQYQKSLPFKAFYHKALYFLTKLWNSDITHAKNISENAYGAGYEVTILKQEGFEKLSDILIHSSFIFQDKMQLRVQGKLSKIDYYEDLLTIRIYQFDINQAHPVIQRKDTYIIAPLDYKVDQLDVKKLLKSLPDFNSTFTGLNVLEYADESKFAENDSTAHYVYVFINGDRKGPIRQKGSEIMFSKEGGELLLRRKSIDKF